MIHMPEGRNKKLGKVFNNNNLLSRRFNLPHENEQFDYLRIRVTGGLSEMLTKIFPLKFIKHNDFFI